MKKGNLKKKLAAALGFFWVCAAAKAVDPTSFDVSDAVTTATSNMWGVLGASISLVGVGAAFTYGIKAWKRMRSAV